MYMGDENDPLPRILRDREDERGAEGALGLLSLCAVAVLAFLLLAALGGCSISLSAAPLSEPVSATAR